MKLLKNGLWEYYTKWQSIGRNDKDVYLSSGRLENTWCPECRFCCGPQNEEQPFPMALLPDQAGPDAGKHFYLLNSNTAALGKQGCKSHSSRGCLLPIGQRPVACGLFPLVLANGRLYLYLMCPAVLNSPLSRFMEMAREVAPVLAAYTLADLQHISLDMDLETLSRKYADMHVQIFDASGINIVLD